MCVVDVSLFECGDYSLQLRGLPCSKVVTISPCSRPDVAAIIPRDHSCVRCLYARSLETLISINESMLRWERKCAADDALRGIIWIRRGGAGREEDLAEHERTLQELKDKLEKVRVAQKLPLLFTQGTDDTRRSQMLAIMKFQAQEMRSVLLADDD